MLIRTKKLHPSISLYIRWMQGHPVFSFPFFAIYVLQFVMYIKRLQKTESAVVLLSERTETRTVFFSEASNTSKTVSFFFENRLVNVIVFLVITKKKKKKHQAKD